MSHRKNKNADILDTYDNQINYYKNKFFDNRSLVLIGLITFIPNLSNACIILMSLGILCYILELFVYACNVSDWNDGWKTLNSILSVLSYTLIIISWIMYIISKF